MSTEGDKLAPVEYSEGPPDKITKRAREDTGPGPSVDESPSKSTRGANDKRDADSSSSSASGGGDDDDDSSSAPYTRSCVKYEPITVDEKEALVLVIYSDTDGMNWCAMPASLWHGAVEIEYDIQSAEFSLHLRGIMRALPATYSETGDQWNTIPPTVAARATKIVLAELE